VNFANKISTFRIISVPFFIASILYYSPQRSYLRLVALVIFILGVISDAADGYIARKSKQQSPAGLILDPLGDKLLLMSAFITLAVNHHLAVQFPLWVVLVVISRDAIIILGAIVVHMVKQHINIRPTVWGKLTTIFQMLSVIIVLTQASFAFVFWWLAVIFTVISGGDYIKRGFATLYALDNHRGNK
jgi:cardiolipin synthase